MRILDQFANQQYLNLETFRKSGRSMQTPVWFAQDGENLYIRTSANSGKVKRVRNNSSVNIAPCKMDGALIGSWVPATAREIKEDPVADKRVDQLMDKKYGLIKKILTLQAVIQRRKYTILEIKVT